MFAVDAKLLQAIHDYLVSRPMQEVEVFVLEIRKCQPVYYADDSGSSSSLPSKGAQTTKT